MEYWREELYHHGILGMKWGVRRYQNKDGSLTPAGKKRYGADSNVPEKKAENHTKMLTENEKAEIIRAGDPARAYANRESFTNDELQQVINRFNLQQNVKKLATPDNVKTGIDKLNQLNEYMAATAKVSTSGISVYNNAARVTNAFFKTNLPVIPDVKTVYEARKKEQKEEKEALQKRLEEDKQKKAERAVQKQEQAKQNKEEKAEKAVQKQEEEKQRKEEKAERKEQRQEEKAERKEQKQQEEKERIINSADLKAAKENASWFSNDDINKLLDRITINEKLDAAISDAEKKKDDKGESK